MKIIFLFLFLLSFSASAAAQQANCPLEEPPAVLGLKLQMTAEEARGALGGDLKITVKTDGERIIFENFINKPPPARLAGVRALYLRFVDRRLYQIEIFYEETPQIKTLQDFAGSVAARLNFPASRWQKDGNKLLVDCGAYTLAAAKTLNPRLELTDTAARAKVETLREKAGQED